MTHDSTPTDSPGISRALAHELASARRRLGLSARDVAARVGIDEAELAHLEAGIGGIGVALLCRLSDALGLVFEIAPGTGLTARSARPRGLTLADLHARREELLAIASRHGARDVRVIGSVARGQARPDSDVDFLVEMEPERTVLDLSGFILDLQQALGRKVDVIEVGAPSRTLDRLLSESVSL